MSGDAAKKAKTVMYKLDPTNPPPPSGCSVFDKLTEEEVHAAALSDPDAQPWTEEQFTRAKRRVDVRLIRERFGLSQAEFVRPFCLKLEMVRGWEDRTLVPDTAAVTLLHVIWAEPETVRRVVAVG